MSLLQSLNLPDDLESLSVPQLKQLAEEIRQTVIDTVSKVGGHLGSNLGVAELTIALHRIFNSPEDKLIYDTSHQSYPHKLLSGRAKDFHTLRTKGGLSGFCEPNESEHDHFFAGHGATALSLALGQAKARDICGDDNYVVPIIGDAVLACGLTLEALNNIPRDLKRFIIILNDNKMSIAKSVGRISNILNRLVNSPRSNRLFHEIEQLVSKVPACGSALAKQGHKFTEGVKNMVSSALFFEQYGLSYVGPIDGHNIEQLLSTLEEVKKIPKPVIVHVLTTKGKGLDIASNNPSTYHGCKPFDKTTGEFLKRSATKPSFPKIFGKYMLELADKDPNLVTITPAMPIGSCLIPFMEKYPKRCIDVGIAEGHAVTFAGGIAKHPEMKVVCVVYATFFQRAFDNLFHDVCLQNAPVLFCLDRAGFGGSYGPTHHGIYDISFLVTMPNLIICQPRNGHILKELISSAFEWKQPAIIRYPDATTEEPEKPIEHKQLGKGEVLCQGQDVAILALGHLCDHAMKIKELLEKEEIYPTIIDPVFIKPLDENLIAEVLKEHQLIITLEEHSIHGGFGSMINNFAIQNDLRDHKILNLAVPDKYIPHGSLNELYHEIELDPESIAATIKNEVKQLKPLLV